MNPSLLSALGGLGLFLFAIRFMTQALHRLSGQKLHTYLARASSTPAKGAVTGGIVTALLQSSSATSVAVVSFTGAGLLSFEQGLGIIIGANVGTTFTGWIIALFGFKFKLTQVSLLIIFCASLLRLLSKKRALSAATDALIGFALLFIGIDLLQTGLSDAQHWIPIPEGLSGTLLGRFTFLGIGILLALLTQSSSATIATALTAVSTGIIDLPEALALSIGADVGITGTALLASLGTSTNGRRSGMAHLIYNLGTAFVAFFLISPFLFLLHFLPLREPTLAIVAFHSGFNLLGVLLILPITAPFARLIKRLIPRKKAPLTRELTAQLLDDPEAAFQAVSAVTHRVTAAAAAHLAQQTKEEHLDLPHLTELDQSVASIRHFLREITCQSLSGPQQERFASLLHAIDHLERLIERCQSSSSSNDALKTNILASDLKKLHENSKELTRALLKRKIPHPLLASLAAEARHLEDDDQGHRREVILSIANGQRAPLEADQILDAHRWIRRTSWHIWRIASYIEKTA